MAWFFTEPFEGQHHIITGENAVHIEKSLRMKIGEALTLVDSDGIQYSCIIKSFSGGCVEVRAEKKFRCENEPDVHITLYQSLPKSDKMDFIIQKAVDELEGSIVPHDTVIDELKALAKKQNIDDENLAVAMAVYMLGFGSYKGFITNQNNNL